MLRRQAFFSSSSCFLPKQQVLTLASSSSVACCYRSCSSTENEEELVELLPNPLLNNSFDKTRHQRNLQVTSVASKEVSEIVTSIKEGIPQYEKARKLHLSRKKLLVRDRISKLLDPGTDFFELSPLAGFCCYPRDIVPAGGVVTGIGKIMNTRCMIIANDATVKGGIYFPAGCKKQLRAQKIAQQNCLPCVYLVDSGGGNLEYQAEAFANDDGFGRTFYNQAHMSALGIPQVSVVMGSCTAGGAYIPCMCDETIIVKGTGTIFLGGPQLVMAATGEVCSAEELGGGLMHSTKSGVADHLADSDEQALKMCRRAVKNLNRKSQKNFLLSSSSSETNSSTSMENNKNNKINISDIAGFVDPIEVAHEHKKEIKNIEENEQEKIYVPVNTHGVISHLVDNSVFDEFKKLYGVALTCGFAEIEGIECGIIADNGTTLCEDAGLKGTHFVQICAQRKIPLIFLQGGGTFCSDASSSSTEKTAEIKFPNHVASAASGNNINAGKHAAKFASAVATCGTTIPKITMVVRGSIGDGGMTLGGRQMEPRFLFLWPSAKISMASDAISNYACESENLEKIQGAGSKLALEQMKLDAKKYMVGPPTNVPILSSIFSSANCFDDGVVHPEESRKVLGEVLRCCLCEESFQRSSSSSSSSNANTLGEIPSDSPKYGVFRM